MAETINAAALIPPFRFGIVQEGVYRGAYPKDRNLRFLDLLALKTIIALTPDKPTEILQSWRDARSIRTIHFKVEKVVDDNVPLTHNIAARVIELLMDPSLQPIYVHCLDGADVTGLVVASFRKLQLWSRVSILSELSRCLMRTTGVISSDQSTFIDRFTSFGPSASVKEIKVPQRVPLWLWPTIYAHRQTQTSTSTNDIHPCPPFRHPSLKLSFPDDLTQSQMTPTVKRIGLNVDANAEFIKPDDAPMRRTRTENGVSSSRIISGDVGNESDTDISEYSNEEMSMSLTLRALNLEGT